MSGDNANAVLTVCAEQVITRLFDAIGREFGYLFSYKTNIKNLKNQVMQMENLKEDVVIFLKEQGWNNTEGAKAIDGWLAEVKEMTSAANKAMEDKDKLRVRCMNLKNIRYQQSKKSTKLVAEIQKLLNKAPKTDAIHQAPPAAMLQGAAANDAAKDFISRTKIVGEVMDALNDEEINVIGICGLGGIGKTTILHEVRERARTQFDMIPMTTVSQVINVFEIQKNLAGTLGLKSIQEVDDIIPRADLLHKRLTNGSKNLIILDDLWSEIKLNEVGIPVGNGMARCKVILASRYENVCTIMRTQKTIPVGVLSKDEAWHMFKKAAGDCIERQKLEKIAKEIVDKCGGLPIALVTIAGALFNKKKSYWEDAHRLLRQSIATSIAGMKEAYLPIMVSYKLLATHELQEAQPLLLICGQHGEDEEILVEKLARYCLALELFEGVDKLVEARNRTYKLIEDLKSYFLLQAVDVDEEGMYEKVKMHDVVRDVCLSIVSEVKEEKDRVYMHIMSQDSDGGHDLGNNNEVDYSKLKLLMVADYYDGDVHSIEQMEELRILEIGKGKSDYLKPKLQVLNNLRMLCIESEGCLGEDTVAAIGNLSSLEILFWRSRNSFPHQIGQLRNLKLLDIMTFYHGCNIFPSGILPQLNKLELLCVGNYGLLGTGVDSYIEYGESYGRITELESLPNLTTLQITLGDPTVLLDLKCFPFENLETFDFSISNRLFWRESSLVAGKSITLIGADGMKWVKEANIQYLIRSSLTLRIKENDDWTDPLILKEFLSLETLKLKQCYELEYIIPNGSLAKLRTLKLTEMYRMRRVWMGPIDHLCLVNLRQVILDGCKAMETLFPHTIAKCFVQLQELIISWCPKLEGIFSKGDLGTTCSSATEIRKETLNDFTVHLPKLRILTLVGLDKLLGFYNANIDDGKVLQHLINPRVIMLPSLEQLRCRALNDIKQIVGGGVLELSKLAACNWLQNLQEVNVSFCDSLETLFDFEGLHFMGENAQLLALGGLKYIDLVYLPKLEHLFWQIPQGILSFQNLETLKVDGCPNLGYLMSSSMAHMLVKLKTLVVYNCKSIKVVIKMDEVYDVKKILFLFLSDVTLLDLENLSSFCSDDRQSIEFPSLDKVVIDSCPEMKTFCCGDLTAEKLREVTFSYTAGSGITLLEGDLNKTVRFLSERVYETRSDTEQSDDPDEHSVDEGMQMKASIPLSIVTSPNASLTSNAVSDNNKSIANSSSPDLKIEASTEQSVYSSNDSPVLPKADKELPDMSSSNQDESGSSIPFDWGMPEKDSMPISIASSSNALLTPVVSPSPPVSDNDEELANSSTPNVRKVASMEHSVHSATDSRVQPKAEKELSNMSLSNQDDDWKRNRILIQGVYIKSEWKTTFEEILTAKPNFLSSFRLKIARVKTEVMESAIRSLQILQQRTALTISSEELAYIKDSLNDLETIGLDTSWLERGYQRAITVIKEQEAVSAAAKLAMLEKEKMEDEAKLEASTARLDAFKAEYNALMQELEAGKELSGGGFDLETCLGDGLLD